MTISSTSSREVKNGNGAATSFSFSFKINSAADLRVTRIDTGGTETVLSVGTGTTNYSITVANYPGTGSITYPASLGTKLASGEKLVLERIPDIEQETDLQNQGAYKPEVVEAALDYLTMIALMLDDALDRSVKLSVGSSLTDITLPEPSAEKVLGWNSGATDLENKTVNSGSYLTMPGSSTDNAVPRFDGTSGTALQVSGVVIDDSANITGVGNINGHTANNLLESGDIGTSVQGYNADTLFADVADTLTAHMSMTLQTDSSSSNAVTCDFAGGDCSVTLSENITDINFTNLPNKGWSMLLIKQASSGGPYTVTGYDTNVDHPAATAPIISTTANAVDLFGLYNDGSNVLMVPIQQDVR